MTSRRQFLQASAAVGGGLALEFSLAAPALAQAGAAPPVEVTHWLVIHPDERIVIRTPARRWAGSLTGLRSGRRGARLRLEARLDRVRLANEHVKRKRIWGSMSTGGSAGIRIARVPAQSGASAREMRSRGRGAMERSRFRVLGRRRRHHTAGRGAPHDYGKVAVPRRESRCPRR